MKIPRIKSGVFSIRVIEIVADLGNHCTRFAGELTPNEQAQS